MRESRSMPDTTPPRRWNTLAEDRRARLERAAAAGLGRQVAAADAVKLLEILLQPHDRVCIEGNNQKHADFLSTCLAQVDPERVHGLHIVQSNLALPAHLDVFERGIAAKLDFCYSGDQGVRMGRLVKEGRIEVGAIHTYLELYSRYF